MNDRLIKYTKKGRGRRMRQHTRYIKALHRVNITRTRSPTNIISGQKLNNITHPDNTVLMVDTEKPSREGRNQKKLTFLGHLV